MKIHFSISFRWSMNFYGLWWNSRIVLNFRTTPNLGNGFSECNRSGLTLLSWDHPETTLKVHFQSKTDRIERIWPYSITVDLIESFSPQISHKYWEQKSSDTMEEETEGQRYKESMHAKKHCMNTLHLLIFICKLVSSGFSHRVFFRA